MKKSELKALIREVIEEISNSDITTDGLGSNGFKLANIAGKVFWKKGNLLIYLVKQGNSGEQKWYATTDKVQGDKLPYIPYEKSQVKTMNDILKLDGIVNSKYQVHETKEAGDNSVEVWEVYERNGSGCVGYLNKEDAQNSDVFEDGYDRIVQSTVRVSPKELNTLKSGGFIVLN